MRRNLIVLIIMLVILGLSLWLTLSVDRSAEELLEIGQAAFIFYQKGEILQAERAMRLFDEKWKKTEPVWDLLVPQNEVDAVSDLLEKTQTLLDADADPDHMLAGFLALNDAVSQIHKQEIPSLRGFL